MFITNLLSGKSIFDCNCYGIKTEKAAIIIDPSVFDKSLTDFFGDEKLEKLILITHAHLDHISGAEALRKETGAKIGIGEDDAKALINAEYNLSYKFGDIVSFKCDMQFKDGEEIKVGDLTVKVIKTPGHTVGGVCYLIDNNLFSGDTLFCETVGRTDLIGGSFIELQNSLKKLITLDDNITVYTGHGANTTIAHEKKYNPYILGLKY